MDVIIERACGMDVHKDNITACIITLEGKEIKTFSTKTVFLIQLVDWIKEHRCTHVAMESTSVYWKPIVNLLEAEDIEFLVVNAQHIKSVPGRKTDVKDAEWIAKLLRHGLLRASFIPDRNQRELRELVRYRRTAARKGKKRAGIVVAHAILRISYYLLTRKEMYVDLGEDYFDKQKQQSIVRHSLRRLESLGYTVSIVEPEAS